MLNKREEAELFGKTYWFWTEFFRFKSNQIYEINDYSIL
jgi:hypothetical protein